MMHATIEESTAIMQAMTIDVWNNSSKSERIALMGEYCSPSIKAYAPDGTETVGYEDVS